MFKIPFTDILIGRPEKPATSPASSRIFATHRGRRLAVTDDDPTHAGGGLSSGATAIQALVSHISTDGIDLRTTLELRHIIRRYISDVQTAIIYRRAIEGELLISSDDAGLEEELREFCKRIPVGYVGGEASARGLDAYLDALANGADEYGLSVGEKIFEGRRLARLVTPDVRTFSLEKTEGSGGLLQLVQDQKGKKVVIGGGAIHTLTFRVDSSEQWPPAMIWGAELIAEALLRMLTSLNTIWLKAGDPPMVYSIEYDAEAQVPIQASTDSAGNLAYVDDNIEALTQAIQATKKARARGMMAEIVFSVVGGKLHIESAFGNPTTEGLVKEAEPHFRIASGLIAQMSEVPSWVFTSGSNNAEGIGSNRANQEAAIAFRAAERRRRKLAVIARDVLNTYILGERSTRALDNFRLEWTAPSIVDDSLIEQTRKHRADADSVFVRTSFELFNTEGGGEDGEGGFTAEQREYLERNGVLPPTDPEA